MVSELLDDGYIKEVEDEVTGHRMIEPTQTDPPVEYSHLAYPAR